MKEIKSLIAENRKLIAENELKQKVIGNNNAVFL